MGNAMSQSFPPAPTFTEKELPDQSGKVFIVTGSSSGVGLALAKILYGKNSTVYVAARSEEKAKKAIEEIKSEYPSSTGKVVYLFLDLGDLTTIKASAEEFLKNEQRLDVLWNNAGVMVPPAGSETKQGYELQQGTNCLGPFLFTQYLLPILKKTAASSPKDSVRVAWAGSLTIDVECPQYGMDPEDISYQKPGKQSTKYAVSKCGNLFIGHAFAKRVEADGIISMAFNPGNLKSELQRNMSSTAQFLVQPILHQVKFGAYTELYCGLSPEIKMEHTGGYVIPWGRIGNPRNDIAQAMKPLNQGGKNSTELFYKYCETETSKYL